MEKLYELKRAYRDNLPHEEILKLYEVFEDKDAEIESNKNTLIHWAANYADHVAVKYLLDNGVKANIINDYGYTPLRSLCDIRDIMRDKWLVTNDDVYKTACLLLDAKVSILKKDESGNTCAFVAAERGIYPLIKALIDKGAKIDFLNSSGMTPLHGACEYIRHELSSLEYAKKDLDKRREIASKPSGSDRLDQINQESLVTAEKGVEEATAKIESYYNIVKALVESGMDIDVKDDSGNTALDYAIECDAKKIAAYLKGGLDDANEDELIAGGMNLHQAASKNDVAAINALIRLGADINEVSDDEDFKGMTPLAAACHYMRAEGVEALIAHSADPNSKSGENAQTPIQWLIRYSYSNFRDEVYKNKSIQRIIKSLISAGLVINDFVNDNYDTALISSADLINQSRSNSQCLGNIVFDAFMSAGADLNIANKEGKTPLMIVLHKDSDAENYLIDILENSARIDVADINGQTPLMYAITNREKATARTFTELLVQFGDVKPEAVNNSGKSALDLATDLENEEVVKFLLTL